MIREDKELLLQDLCARLLYGVIGEYSWKGNEPYNRELTGSLFDELKSSWDSTEDSEFLPYLRPLSSMTEEEQKEFVKFHCVNICPIVITEDLTISNETQMFDWLNKKMFDYRGLIPSWLALEAPEGMYNN